MPDKVSDLDRALIDKFLSEGKHVIVEPGVTSYDLPVYDPETRRLVGGADGMRNIISSHFKKRGRPKKTNPAIKPQIYKEPPPEQPKPAPKQPKPARLPKAKKSPRTKVISGEIADQVTEMTKDGKSVAVISTALGLKPGTVRRFVEELRVISDISTIKDRAEERRIRILPLLQEGISLSAIARLEGVSVPTIYKDRNFLRETGRLK